MAHKNLYIVDNSSEDQSVKKYLTEWCSVSKQMDIATGYLEIGGLLTLDTHWQKLDKIRIILGNEVTKRTKDVIDAAVAAILNKLKNLSFSTNIYFSFPPLLVREFIAINILRYLGDVSGLGAGEVKY